MRHRELAEQPFKKVSAMKPERRCKAFVFFPG